MEKRIVGGIYVGKVRGCELVGRGGGDYAWGAWRCEWSGVKHGVLGVKRRE